MKLKSPDLRIWRFTYLGYTCLSYEIENSSFAGGNLEFFFFVLRMQKLEIHESPVSLCLAVGREKYRQTQSLFPCLSV